MINRKLLKIIGLWDKDERKEFHVFLSSPYFNKGVQAPILLHLYSIILKCQANAKHPKLQKEALSKQLWNNLEFEEKDRNRLDQLGTRLLALVEQFIGIQHYESTRSEAGKLIPMLKFYRKNHLEERFWQASHAVKKALDQWPFKDAWQFFDEFEYYLEVNNVSTPFSSNKKDLGIDRADQALDRFFAAVKLEFEITKRFHARIFNAPHQTSPLFFAIRDWIPSLEDEIPPLIYLQNEIIRMQNEQPSVEAVLALEEKLNSLKHLFPFELATFLHTCTRSLVTSFWHKSNDITIRQALFQHMERHFKEGYVFIDGKLSTASLRVYLTSSLDLNKTEWAKKLLEDFPPDRLLGTKYPAEFCKLNWAYYYFHIKDYENAENHITHSNFEYQLYGILAEVQLMKIYFETGNTLLDSRMQAFSMKLRRANLPTVWKKRLSNFEKYLGEVDRLRWVKNEPLRLKTLAALQATGDEVTEKWWLLEKLKN